MVDKGGGLGDGPRCNKKEKREREKERERGEGRERKREDARSSETGNILTSDRTLRLNKILGIIVPRSTRTGAINSLAWLQCLNVPTGTLPGPFRVSFEGLPLPFYRGSSFCAPLYACLLKTPWSDLPRLTTESHGIYTTRPHTGTCASPSFVFVRVI